MRGDKLNIRVRVVNKIQKHKLAVSRVDYF
jgi:hypothetical protein